MRHSFAAYALLIPGLLSLAACDRDDTNATTDPDAQTGAEQALVVSAAFATAGSRTNSAAQQNGGLNGLQGESPELQARTCGTNTFVSTPNTFFPATLTLNYGTACTDAWGRELGGELVATFDGFFSQRGTSIEVGFNNFKVDGHRLSGDYRINNTGLDAEGRQTFRHEIVNGSLTYPDGRRVGYAEVVTSVRVAGQATDFFTDGLAGLLDDVWADTRTATVDASDGNRYTVTTTTALRRPVTCDRVVAGTYEITSSGLSGVGTLDFGSGACDREAVLTYAGQTYVIQL